MKHLLLLCLFLAGCSRSTRVSGGRVLMADGGFSLQVPEGWELRNVPGMDFPILTADPVDGFRPNLFVDGVEEGTVSQVELQLFSRYRNPSDRYNEVSRTEWVSTSGNKGHRLTSHRYSREGLALISWHYLIQEDDRVIAITATCARETSDRLAPVFDAAVSSILPEPIPVP